MNYIQRAGRVDTYLIDFLFIRAGLEKNCVIHAQIVTYIVDLLLEMMTNDDADSSYFCALTVEFNNILLSLASIV